MYVVYEEHIEQLELENKELKKQVLYLKKKLNYTLSISDNYEEGFILDWKSSTKMVRFISWSALGPWQ